MVIKNFSVVLKIFGTYKGIARQMSWKPLFKDFKLQLHAHKISKFLICNNNFIPLCLLNFQICIGERFALMEIKLVLAKFLMNFEFELDRSKTPVPLEYKVNRMLLTPATGIYVKTKKINE